MPPSDTSDEDAGPWDDDDHFHGTSILTLGATPNSRVKWEPGDRIAFCRHAARYQITTPNMRDYGADDLMRDLGLEDRSQYYRGIILRKAQAAIEYLVGHTLKGKVLKETLTEHPVTGAPLTVLRWPAYTLDWLRRDWDGAVGRPQRGRTGYRTDPPGRRAATPQDEAPRRRGEGMWMHQRWRIEEEEEEEEENDSDETVTPSYVTSSRSRSSVQSSSTRSSYSRDSMVTRSSNAGSRGSETPASTVSRRSSAGRSQGSSRNSLPDRTASDRSPSQRTPSDRTPSQRTPSQRTPSHRSQTSPPVNPDIQALIARQDQTDRSMRTIVNALIKQLDMQKIQTEEKEKQLNTEAIQQSIEALDVPSEPPTPRSPGFDSPTSSSRRCSCHSHSDTSSSNTHTGAHQLPEDTPLSQHLAAEAMKWQIAEWHCRFQSNLAVVTGDTEMAYTNRCAAKVAAAKKERAARDALAQVWEERGDFGSAVQVAPVWEHLGGFRRDVPGLDEEEGDF